MPRIPLLSLDSPFDDEQKRVLEGLLGRRGGRIPGPYRFTMHCPKITELMHPFGEILRLQSSFPLRLSEFAIIITAREWDCDYVFNAHAGIARDNGLPQALIDAVARNERPNFEKEDEEAIYDYLTELFRNHAISDKAHARAKELFGVPGVVELTLLSGYYGMVSMTLLAHGMPLPEGAKPPLTKRR